jgi:hypothetical protein
LVEGALAKGRSTPAQAKALVDRITPIGMASMHLIATL